jgi:hypothetical protein
VGVGPASGGAALLGELPRVGGHRGHRLSRCRRQVVRPSSMAMTDSGVPQVVHRVLSQPGGIVGSSVGVDEGRSVASGPLRRLGGLSAVVVLGWGVAAVTDWPAARPAQSWWRRRARQPSLAWP